MPWRDELRRHYSHPHHSDQNHMIERTVATERDLHHMRDKMDSMGISAEALGLRVNQLSERVRDVEQSINHVQVNMEDLETMTHQLREGIPNIAGLLKTMRWLTEGLKYFVAIAIFVGWLTGRIGWETVQHVFAP